MGYCRQCGAELNGANFCANCGALANQEAIATQRQSRASMTAAMRKQSLNEMQEIMLYFTAKHAEYDKYVDLGLEIAKRKEKSYKGWLIASLAIGIPMYLFVKSGSNVNFFHVLFFEIPSIIMIAVFFLLRKKNKEKITIAQKRQDKVRNFLANYYDAYGECPIGLKYTFPEDLAGIYDELNQGKAHTIEDALNCYIERLHREKLEAEAARTRQMMAEVEKNTREAAQEARRAANYAEATYWFRD